MDGSDGHPELCAFLAALRPGLRLSGTVAAIERFGVFVALEEGPDHPLFPGVGFVALPDLSWHHFGKPEEAVRVGQRVTGEFLYFDTWNLEARLSLRALVPDPFQAFADRVAVGRTLRGRVTLRAAIGVFVEVGEGVEGLIPAPWTAGAGSSVPGTAGTGPSAPGAPGAMPSVPDPAAALRPGDEVTVVVTEIDRERRRLVLAR
ncbi:S1 RNA-binding domain-containing protein [Streptomyces sp. NPDC000594]|uniref:S1 RNA-binding domain-containing protein n=1 Tax=Streptomyces sp. NPDC000594 TaxID=3154261 RepID=UPI0033249CA3